MAANNIPNSDRSIHVGGDIAGSALVTGDNNTVSVEFKSASLPKPEAVDIYAEIKAVCEVLASLNDPIAAGFATKLKEEASKPEPDKSVIVNTLELGLTYSKTLTSFAEAIDKLRPHVEATAGWLGKHGYKLLPLVGLVI